jgi:hypothetical protein
MATNLFEEAKKMKMQRHLEARKWSLSSGPSSYQLLLALDSIITFCRGPEGDLWAPETVMKRHW